MRYVDIETNEILTTEQLQIEYKELKATNQTEAESFADYLKNCLEGSLERLKEDDE